MIFLLNTNCPYKERKPNVDGVIVKKKIGTKHFEKINNFDWVWEFYVFKWQFLIAIGECANIWINHFNLKNRNNETVQT